MKILQRMPRIMVGAIAAICASSVVLIVIALTGMVGESRADRPQTKPSPSPSAEATTEPPLGGTFYTPDRAVSDDDDTSITVESDRRSTPTTSTPSRTTTPDSTPSTAAENDATDTVDQATNEAAAAAERAAEEAERAVKRLNDITASTIAGVP